ncbi:MAG: hypothetical protein H0U57_08370 [Tatlockia sp.]|nr:hypothetical protein [Tatlockia sp.]
MSLRRGHDDDEHQFSDYSYGDDSDTDKLSHRRQVRKVLEEKLERKRLKEELDELDGEFDWKDYES